MRILDDFGRVGVGRACIFGATAFPGERSPSAESPLARQFPPAGRFVEVGDVALHYVERGSGRPLVFLHGAGGMSAEFLASPLADLLAARYRTIIFDRPGFGHSTRSLRDCAGPLAQARLVRTALATMGIERPILVGHSWGGAMALSYATAFPAHLSALVVLAGWAFPARRAAILLFSLPQIRLFGSLLPQIVWPQVARRLAPEMLRRIFAPNPVPENFAARFPVELALRPSQLLADAEDLTLLNPCVARLAAAYPSIGVPVELVTGDRDQIVDPQFHALRLARLIPSALVTLLDGVGHMLHHVAAPRILAAIDRAAARST